MGDIYLWRQVFILTTTIFTSISSGIMIAFPSVLLPAILSTNSTDIKATADQVSWISTSNGIASIFGFFVLSPLMQIFGRKVAHIADNLSLCIGWITFALAHNTTALLVARIIQGVNMGNFYVHVMIVSEYSDPKRRGYFITFKKTAVAIGTVMCHALCLLWNWRQIAILAAIFPALSTVLSLFWPESPSYLAMKGRYKESEKSFVWLYGGSNMQELHLLHSSQLDKAKNLSKEKWYKFLLKKDFLKPFVIVSLLTLILELSGKHYFMVYIIQMMMELVGDKSLAIYLSIGVDLFTLVALISSFFIISHFKRRIILFSFGITTVSLMLIIWLAILLKSSSIWRLAPALIILHSFIVNISIVPVCFTLFSEIFPLEHKGWGSCLNGIIFMSLYTLMLKLTPVLIESTGVGGVNVIYGIGIAVCLLVLYFILPETTDRTLQEIENEFKGVDKCENEMLN